MAGAAKQRQSARRDSQCAADLGRRPAPESLYPVRAIRRCRAGNPRRDRLRPRHHRRGSRHGRAEHAARRADGLSHPSSAAFRLRRRRALLGDRHALPGDDRRRQDLGRACRPGDRQLGSILAAALRSVSCRHRSAAQSVHRSSRRGARARRGLSVDPYRARGGPRAPMSKRQSLLLLSGLICDETIWQDIAPRLAGVADLRMYSFPGFDSISAMAKHVLQTAPEHFALAGHSMGGRVALEIMRAAPSRVLRLALLNTGARAAPESEAQTRRRLVAIAREQGMTALAPQWLPPMMGAPRARIDAVTPRLTGLVGRF